MFWYMKKNDCKIMQERCDLRMVEQTLRILPILWSTFMAISLANGRVLIPCKSNDDCSSQFCVRKFGSDYGVCRILERNLSSSVLTSTYKSATVNLNSSENLHLVYSNTNDTLLKKINSGKSLNVAARNKLPFDVLKQLVNNGRSILLNNNLELQINFSAEKNFSTWLISAKLAVNPKLIFSKSNESTSPIFATQNEVVNNITGQLNNDYFVEDRVHNINKSDEISNNTFISLWKRRQKLLELIHGSTVKQKQNEFLVTVNQSDNSSRSFMKKVSNNLGNKKEVKEKNRRKTYETVEKKAKNSKNDEMKDAVYKNFLGSKSSVTVTEKAVAQNDSFLQFITSAKKYFENLYKLQLFKKLLKSNQNFSKLLTDLNEYNWQEYDQRYFINNDQLNVDTNKRKIKNSLVSNHSFLPFITSNGYSSNKTIIPISEKNFLSVDSKKLFPSSKESKQLVSNKDQQQNPSAVKRNRSKRSLEFNENQVANYKVNNIKERQKRSLDGFQNSLLSESELGGSAAKIPRQIIEEAIVEPVMGPPAVLVEEETPTMVEEVVSQPEVIEEVVVKKRSGNKRLPHEDIIKGAFNDEGNLVRTSRHVDNKAESKVIRQNRQVLSPGYGGDILNYDSLNSLDSDLSYVDELGAKRNLMLDENSMYDTQRLFPPLARQLVEDTLDSPDDAALLSPLTDSNSDVRKRSLGSTKSKSLSPAKSVVKKNAKNSRDVIREGIISELVEPIDFVVDEPIDVEEESGTPTVEELYVSKRSDKEKNKRQTATKLMKDKGKKKDALIVEIEPVMKDTGEGITEPEPLILLGEPTEIEPPDLRVVEKEPVVEVVEEHWKRKKIQKRHQNEVKITKNHVRQK